MLCPYCNKEMKLGEITSKWKSAVAPELYIDEHKQIPLTNSLSPFSFLVGDKLQCYYCLDCHKIILNIPEKI